MRTSSIVMVLLLATLATAQPLTIAPEIESAEVAAANSGFHSAVIRAARNRVQAGEMSRREFVRLRVAMLSPAFREHAENLAVTQMAFSGEDVPLDAAGAIDRASIDWDSSLEFLEKLVPLLLKLLTLFGI